MRVHRTPEPTKRDTRMRLKIMATLLLGAVLACDSLLNVQSPSRVPASVLDDPANAELAVNGAQADFECALASYAALGGMLAGELEDVTLSAGGWGYDRGPVPSRGAHGAHRSEERRGGEEGRYRGGPDYLKKKKKTYGALASLKKLPSLTITYSIVSN